MNKKLCGRTPGITLSATGRRQAAALAEGLRSRTLNAIYSSPLERAFETAQLVAEPHALVPQTDDRLNELDFGDWTGKTFEELEPLEKWRDYNRERSRHPPPGGEPPVDALARAGAALSDFEMRHAGMQIALVTHADVIRSLITRLLDMPLDHLLRFEISPASVTEVSIENAYTLVHSMNRIF